MEGVVVADSALRQRWASKTELRRVLAGCNRWPGVGDARIVVEFANGLSESVFESIARVDFLWRAHGVVAEADGLLKYQGGADAIKELKRDRLLRDQGLEVVHLSWSELFGSPDLVVTRILNSFERARRLRPKSRSVRGAGGGGGGVSRVRACPESRTASCGWLAAASHDR
jgi:hypothetical protein